MNPLTFDDYQEGTGHTAVYPGRGTLMGLLYAALGLGEAGELQGKVKKMLRDDDGMLTERRRIEIADELGDLLWYASAVSAEIGIPLGLVAQANLEKLQDRKTRGVLRGDGDKR